MLSTEKLWHSTNEQDWIIALKRYWDFVKPSNIHVEKELESIDITQIKEMNKMEWYEFLLNKYFFWKFTAPNRYKTTTYHLKKYFTPKDNLESLLNIKKDLLLLDKENIAQGLKVALKIKGLGPAGASGLLAILYPEYFSTVDQFAVKALSQICDLPEKKQIAAMTPEHLKIEDGVILIQIMKRKAKDLNTLFRTNQWTPRKIDMVLWVIAR